MNGASHLMMVGRKVESIRLDDRKKSDKTILQVKGLSVPNRVRKIEAVKNVSFSVKAGEIVTLAGIEGNGQSELVYAVTGLEKSSAGSIEFNGIDITVKNIRSRSALLTKSNSKNTTESDIIFVQTGITKVPAEKNG